LLYGNFLLSIADRLTKYSNLILLVKPSLRVDGARVAGPGSDGARRQQTVEVGAGRQHILTRKDDLLGGCRMLARPRKEQAASLALDDSAQGLIIKTRVIGER